jgi:hypothetical protein
MTESHEQEPGERDAELAEEAEGSGTPHTSPEEGHPAGEGERSDRDIGGPTTGEDEEEMPGGGHGTAPDSGFESHE